MQIHSKYQIFPDLNLVFVQRSEKFSFGAMFSTFKDILSDPDFNTGMNFLVDSQKVDYSSANYAAFSVQQEVWSSTHNKLGPCKMAFLQQDATNYGISRQASSMFSPIQLNANRFEIFVRPVHREPADCLLPVKSLAKIPRTFRRSPVPTP